MLKVLAAGVFGDEFVVFAEFELFHSNGLVLDHDENGVSVDAQALADPSFLSSQCLPALEGQVRSDKWICDINFGTKEEVRRNMREQIGLQEVSELVAGYHFVDLDFIGWTKLPGVGLEFTDQDVVYHACFNNALIH